MTDFNFISTKFHSLDKLALPGNLSEKIHCGSFASNAQRVLVAHSVDSRLREQKYHDPNLRLKQYLASLKRYYSQRKSFLTLMEILRVAICGIFILFLSGCSTTRSVTETSRTFIEQVLITQSIEDSLNHARIPLPSGSSVQVAAAGLTGDKDFATSVFETWLGRQGYKVTEKNADYKIRIIWHGIGTDHNEFFFGLPPINSTFIPIATPELSFYKSVEEDAATQLSISITKTKDGQFISSTPAYEGGAYYAVRTVLFGLTFESTTLAHPPPR